MLLNGNVMESRICEVGATLSQIMNVVIVVSHSRHGNDRNHVKHSNSKIHGKNSEIYRN
jgi:hypothetical protein